MPEKSFYSGLYKEGFVLKDGNLKDSPDYNRFSDIIQKIDLNQRLLYLEWDGSNLFLGVQFHCSNVVSTKDNRPVRDSRRMYFEQIPYGKNDPPLLPLILQQFYRRADNTIKSFYSERYANIQTKLATSEDFNEFISRYNPKSPLSPDYEIIKYFGGKILFKERCTVQSSDFTKSIKMITDLFEVLKHDKKKIVCIISELDNPNDAKLVWDFLIRIPAQNSNNNQNVQSFTYNADTQTFSESSFTQGVYKSLYNYFTQNRPLIQKDQDSNTLANNFIQFYLSSKESAKLPIGELCKSNLGTIIAKELIIKKLQNNEKIESEILKHVYVSQTDADQADLGKTLLDYGYDFPELYSGAINKIMSDGDQIILSYFLSKDFPEYSNFHHNIVNTFKKLQWENPAFRSKVKKILGWIFLNYPSEKVGVGGKIFTKLLYKSLSDHEEIDTEFIRKHSEKMRPFQIPIPIIPDKSRFNNPKIRGFIVVYVAFVAGILFTLLFTWFYNQILPGLSQTLNGIIDPTIQFWALISGIIIVILLLGYFIFRRKFKRKQVQK